LAKSCFKFIEKKGTVTHDAAGLARRQMKIILSISPFYCRGLIYQARAGRFTRGFDESNPYNRIDVHFFFAPLRVSSRLIFMAGENAFAASGDLRQRHITVHRRDQKTARACL